MIFRSWGSPGEGSGDEYTGAEGVGEGVGGAWEGRLAWPNTHENCALFSLCSKHLILSSNIFVLSFSSEI